MLLNSVIIILREVLEASILISVMLALSQYFKISFSWLKWSLAIGVGGAIVYAYNVAVISNLLDGVGQEILNASLQYLIYILLAGFCIWFVTKPSQTPISLKNSSRLMELIISLSMVREFSEILIFLNVFSLGSATFMSVMIGAFLGVGIGLSVGIIFYHFLNFLSNKWSFRTIFVVLSFIAAGMLSQATQLLIQADWLPSQHPLWNTSAWIPERSIVGQLLYAIFGYEATPTLIQVCVYFVGLFIILFFYPKKVLVQSAAS